MERNLPEIAEICTFLLSFPVVANSVMRASIAVARQHVHDFVVGLALINGSDQRLQDRDGPVVRAPVAPGLQIVGFRHVPVAPGGGLIRVQTCVRAQLHLLQRIQEIQIGGRIVHRVAAENQKRLDRSVVHVADQVFDRSDFIDGVGFHRVGIDHSLAGVAQLLIERMGEDVNRGRLMLARDDDAGAAIRLQVLEDRGPRRVPSAVHKIHRESRHRARHHAQAMLGHSTRDRGGAFRDIQPRRRRAGVPSRCAAASAVVAGVAQAARHGRVQKIRIQRNDDVGAVHAINRVEGPAERRSRARSRGMPAARLVLVPFGRRERG